MENRSPRARAIRALRGWIETGELVAGMPLPPERELCVRLSVGRETVRRALLVLEGEGLIRSAGPHTRMLNSKVSSSVNPTPQGNAVMQKTVVITSNIRRPSASHRRGGWSDHIPYGAFESLHAKSIHAMQLMPEQVTHADFNELIASRPYGFIVTGHITGAISNAEFLASLKRAGIPVVVYGDSPELADYDRVISDHEAGARALTEWLIRHDRKAPLCVGRWDRSMYWVRDRLRGHESAMTAAGLTALPPVDLVDCPPMPDAKSRLELMSRLIAGYLAPLLATHRVDSILAASDGIVPAIAAACKLLGKVPNHDIAIVGYDNYWSDAEERTLEPTPPLATVDKQNFELGQDLVNLLVERVEGRLPAAAHLKKLPPRLIEIDEGSAE